MKLESTLPQMTQFLTWFRVQYRAIGASVKCLSRKNAALHIQDVPVVKVTTSGFNSRADS